MKIFSFSCALVLLCATADPSRSQSADPLAENAFPPELLLFYQSEIGLSDDVRNDLIKDVQKLSQKISDLDGTRKKEADALSDLLKADNVNEQAALAQLDNLLDREREIKRSQLSLVIGIKNKLTPEQQAQALDIKKKISGGQLPSPQELQRKLQDKVEKVQQGVQEWQNDNRDPSPIAEIMQEFEPAIKEGKYKDAEAIVDRALKRLGEK